METKQGKNFTAVEVGTFEGLDQVTEGMFKGKLFLKELLGLTGMEVSLNKLPAGRSVPFYHQHKQDEELYIFLKGTGQFQVDDEIFDVKEGSVIRVATAGTRIWRNNSTEDLYYIVIQAQQDSLKEWTREDGIVLPDEVKWPE
ncbi:MAG: cupin domain-containing protein [Tumebacillaceae bacterium]